MDKHPKLNFIYHLERYNFSFRFAYVYSFMSKCIRLGVLLHYSCASLSAFDLVTVDLNYTTICFPNDVHIVSDLQTFRSENVNLYVKI